jgi:hypothetical protein
MSRVDRLNLARLRTHLILAIEGAEGLTGSPYLLAIGACYMACAPDSLAELGVWESLFHAQAQEEGVNGDELLDVLNSVSSITGEA